MGSGITLTETDPGDIVTPSTGKDTIFIDASASPPTPAFKDDAGNVTSLIGAQGPVGPAGPSGAITVNPNGALDGDGSGGSPLGVRVDGVTVQINASNELEAIASVSPGDAMALVGDTLNVLVDGTTIGINASNELESLVTATGTVTHTGNLTAGKTVLGNGVADITVSALTSDLVGSAAGTPTSASVRKGLTLAGGFLDVNVDNETIGLDSNDKLEVITNYALATLANATAIPSSLSGMALIAEVLLQADAASVSFTNIPQTYRHLLVVGYGRITEAAMEDFIYVQFNADGGANYDDQRILGNAITASATQNFAQVKARIGEFPGTTSSTTTQPGSFSATIQNYSGSIFNKIFNSQAGANWGTTAGTSATSGLMGHWRSTAPITRVDILAPANNLKTGSLFSLYGLR